MAGAAFDGSSDLAWPASAEGLKASADRAGHLCGQWTFLGKGHVVAQVVDRRGADDGTTDFGLMGRKAQRELIPGQARGVVGQLLQTLPVGFAVVAARLP